MDRQEKRELMEVMCRKESDMKDMLHRLGEDVRDLQTSDRSQDKEIVSLKATLAEIKIQLMGVIQTIKPLPVLVSTVTRIDKNLSKISWAIILGIITLVINALA